MPLLPRRFHPLKRQAWWPRPGNGFELTELMARADAQAPLVERHIWLIQLLDWIRRGEPLSGTQNVVRLLQQDDAARAKVVALLAAFWRDVDVAALLADYGFAPRSSFINELGERLRRRTLPLSPDTADLAALFNLLFDDADDAEWLSALDEATLDGIAGLWSEAMALQDGSTASHPAELGWREPFFDAMAYLAAQVRATAFSPAFRSRVGTRVDLDFDAEDTPAEHAAEPAITDSGADGARQAFRQLVRVVERMHELALDHARLSPSGQAAPPWPAGLLREAQYLRVLLDHCAQAARGLHGHLEVYGISIDLVFQIDLLCDRCDRIAQLLDVVLSDSPPGMLRQLLVTLAETGQRRRSIRALFTQHYAMLARKVAERSAETGEHYITRNKAEYWDMLKRAGGGGAVLAGTTFMKFVMLAMGLSPFWTGMAAGLNYSVSFVLIHLLHFTVATKQPAMTAPAMAAKLSDTRDDEAIEGFVDEVAHLMRSQTAGILGNLLVVAPVVLLGQALAWYALGKPLIDRHAALHVLETLTLFGPSLWYAAFTGVLLFLASMIAGWTENWFVLHRLDSAMRWNPYIRAWLGPERAARWAGWWRANISGLAANVSLGMMLGVVPVVAHFLALPLDVRHVTLSTGQLMAAAGTLGPDIVHNPVFWWCAAALPLTGMLNVGVSFTLALLVAIRSRNVRVKDRARLRAAIRRRLWRHPFSFLLPPRSSSSSS